MDGFLVVVAIIAIIIGGFLLLFFTPLIVLMIVLAIIFIGVGAIKFAINPYFEKRMQSRLDENHKLLVVRSFKVRVDVNQLIDGFNPYVIDCFYTDPNTQRSFVFTSKPFRNNPSPYLNREEMGVFLDPTDYSNYYVDTSFIPENY